MSLEAQILNAFLEIWETQAELFSERDRAELAQIITNTEDDPQKLADAIAAWYMKPEHQEIANQIESLAFDTQTSEKLSGSTKGKVPDKKAPSQPELLNAVQRSKPKK
jgi:hypothetical protein